MARIHRQSLPGYEVTSSDQADDRICYILGTASGLQGSLGFLRSRDPLKFGNGSGPHFDCR